MEDGPVDTTVALIGELNSARFIRQVTQFVRKVHRVKDIISSRSSQMEITFDELRFREELIGSTNDTVEHDPAVKCDHGLIVTDLYTTLHSHGYKTGNDLTHDLFIVNTKGKVTVVFRIVTDVSTISLNSATAQLLLDNIDLQERPRLVLAVPDNVDDTLKSKLKKLGIDILVYGWQRDQAVFSELENVVPTR
jgi:hypothetical protein